MGKKYDIQPNKLKRLMNMKELSDKDYSLLSKKIARIKTLNKLFFIFIKNFEIRYIIHSDKIYEGKGFVYPMHGKIVKIYIVTKAKVDNYIVPIKFLSSKFNVNKPNDNLVYCHTGNYIKSDGTNYKRENGSIDVEYNYHGITNQTMPVRFQQHQRANSNFGKRYRFSLKNPKRILHSHIIIKDGLTRKDAFDLEESLIRDFSLYKDGMGNNMIPGGTAGLKIAKRLGYESREEAEIELEEAIDDPEKLSKICARVYNWKPTEEQIANIVCNNENNFNKEEIKFIRICSLQMETVKEVYKEFINKFNYPSYKASILDRVDKVINGLTYRFIL